MTSDFLWCKEHVQLSAKEIRLKSLFSTLIPFLIIILRLIVATKDK